MGQERSLAVEPTTRGATRPASGSSRLWLLGTLIAVFILALPSLRYPIGRDQATYCVIGQALLKGKQLYRGLWDNKPPGIFYIYAALVSVFGRVMGLVGVVDVLWLVVIGYFIFRFTERYLGAPSGVIAAALYTLWHERGDYKSAAQPETFILLFVFIADFLLAAKKPRPALRHFLAGILFGAAFWVKYNAGLFLLLGMFLPYLDTSLLDAKLWRVRLTVPWKTWLKRAAILAGGFAATIVAQIAYFGFVGVWPALVQAQFEVLPRYATLILERQPGYLLWALSTIRFNLRPWVEASIAIALAVAWWRREIGRLAPVLISALVGFGVTVSQVRFNSYYFETCLPFLAMICAYLPVALFKEFHIFSAKLRQHKMTLARIVLWIVFVNVVYFPMPALAFAWNQEVKGMIAWVHHPQESYQHYWWPDSVEHLGGQLQVIRYLKANARPQDQIFVWGTAPLIYYLTGKEPPNRFVTNLALISAWGPAAWRQELVRSLKHSPPRFIIVARHDAIYGISYTPLDSMQYLAEYPGLDNIVRTEYREVRPGRNFIIYRRRRAGHPSS